MALRVHSTLGSPLVLHVLRIRTHIVSVTRSVSTALKPPACLLLIPLPADTDLFTASRSLCLFQKLIQVESVWRLSDWLPARSDVPLGFCPVFSRLGSSFLSLSLLSFFIYFARELAQGEEGQRERQGGKNVEQPPGHRRRAQCGVPPCKPRSQPEPKRSLGHNRPSRQAPHLLGAA